MPVPMHAALYETASKPERQSPELGRLNSGPITGKRQNNTPLLACCSAPLSSAALCSLKRWHVSLARVPIANIFLHLRDACCAFARAGCYNPLENTLSADRKSC